MPLFIPYKSIKARGIQPAFAPVLATAGLVANIRMSGR